MPPSVTITFEDSHWRASLPRLKSLTERAVLAALRHEKWSRKNLVINVILSSDAKVRVLNRTWRGKDKPTNVLSFPVEEPHMKVPRGRPRHLGDIVLARQTLLREAKAEGKKLAHHYQHLLVHGTLHLFGHDHLTDAEADVMEAREVRILAGLQVPNPYASTNGTEPLQWRHR